MNMKIIFTLLLFGIRVLYSQNIVINSSCEGASNCSYTLLRTNNSIPSVVDQWAIFTDYIFPVKHACANMPDNYSSPDFYTGNCLNGNKKLIVSDGGNGSAWFKIPYGPHVENGFVGLSGKNIDEYREGVYFKLSESLIPGAYYKLKFKMAVSDSNYLSTDSGDYYDPKRISHQLKIYLAKNPDNWNSSGAHELLGDIVGPAIIPQDAENKWYEFSYSFKVPYELNGNPPTQIQNLMFLIETLADKNNSYVFLDDVSLIHVDYCNLSCRDSIIDKPIEFPCDDDNYYVPNSNLHPQTNELITWKVPVSNATELTIKIFDRWGGKIYEQNYWDPNGLDLKLPGARYFPLQWGGTDFDGERVQTGVYTFLISAKNCADAIYESFDVTFIELSQTVHIPDLFGWNIDTIANCCQETLNIFDRHYIRDTIERADKYINSGVVDSVIVNSGAYVQYFAGISINLGQKFEVKKGADFLASLQFCDLNSQTVPVQIPENWIPNLKSYEQAILKDSSEKKNDILLYPNPFNTNVFVYASKTSSFELFSIDGCLIKDGIIIENSLTSLDLSFLKRGVYIIKMNNEVFKIIKMD